MIDLVRKEIEIGEYLLAKGWINRFAHSVELFNDPKRGGALYPVYRNGDEFQYFGVDDTGGRFAYFRLNGSPQSSQQLKIGSCGKAYIVDAPVRLVVFNDWEKENHDQLVTKFLSVTFMQNVNLFRYSSDMMNLAKEESPIGVFEFGGKTFYLAIDLMIKIELKRDSCEEVCDPFKNPIYN